MLTTITLKIKDTANNVQDEILIASNASPSQLLTAIENRFRIRNYMVKHNRKIISLNTNGTLEDLGIGNDDKISLIPVGGTQTEEVKVKKASIIVKNDDQESSTILVELGWSFQQLVTHLQERFGNRIGNHTVMIKDAEVLTLENYRNFSLEKLYFTDKTVLNIILRHPGGRRSIIYLIS